MFFAACFLDFGLTLGWPFLPGWGGASDVELEPLRLARRFIQPVKGRLRECRSLAMRVSGMGNG